MQAEEYDKFTHNQRKSDGSQSMNKIFSNIQGGQLHHEDSFEPRAFLQSMQSDLPSILDRTITNLSDINLDDIEPSPQDENKDSAKYTWWRSF